MEGMFYREGVFYTGFGVEIWGKDSTEGTPA